MLGFCQCGCGKPKNIAKINRYERGDIKGCPVKFIKGHNPKRSLFFRFWEKVDKGEGIYSCWNWTGAKNKYGYGITWDGSRTVRATHVAYFLETGNWPTQDICHKCDNPSCIRFIHLFQGTAKDNALDALNKGRLKSWNKGKSKLNAKQRQQIKKDYLNGKSCRELGREYRVTHNLISKIVREKVL